MTFKDHFSQQAASYAQYRPRYPDELLAWLASITPRRALAWDCGTGNGQVAVGLTPYFQEIIATDASAEQIDHAFNHEKITYRVAGAEKTDILQASSVDLITVAQAIHWFRLEDFYAEALRVLRRDGIIAIWGYGAFTVVNSSKKGLELITQLTELVEPYWPEEIKWIREEYRTILFPFQEIKTPKFSLTKTLSTQQLIGYFSSWSSTQKLRKDKGGDFVDRILENLVISLESASENSVTLFWPIYLRVGKIPSDTHS